MNKTIIIASLFILWVPGTQANNERPDMKMYVFNAESAPEKLSTAMQMVIFTDDPKMPPDTKKQGENYQLSYADDGQVQVYSTDETNQAYADDEYAVEIYLETGYRQDDLNWNKAGSSGTPNILSELTWDNIEIATVEIGSSLKSPSNWVLDARFAYGTIIDGNNQDSDYLGDNRTQEFSRSNNNADEGNTLDATIGIGYRATIIPALAHFKKPILSFTPKVGYSYHAQNLTVTDGKQTIPFRQTFASLNSKYDTSWYGPWAGFDSELSIVDRFSLNTAFEYHYAYYEATAEWNLRDDREQPESFSHTAEGVGFFASIGSQYKINDDFSLSLSVDYQKWQADKKGRTTEFFVDGSRSSQKLNEVNWESMGANMGLKYTF